MKRHVLTMVAAAGTGLAALLGGGCVTMETPEERMMRAQESATIQHDLRVLLEERQRLVNAVEESRQENVGLNREVKQLGERVALLEQQVTALDANYRQRTQALQEALAREEKARETAVQDVVKTVAKELASTEGRLQDQQRQALRALNSAPPAGGGGSAIQGEYVVQKGDTLATIAKATGITVESLQRANNLSGTVIRIGQKLVIPMK